MSRRRRKQSPDFARAGILIAGTILARLPLAPFDIGTRGGCDAIDDEQAARMTLASRLAARFWSLPKARHRVRVTRGLAVPMRDGIDLVADLYQPDGPPQPTILIRSTYGRGAVFGMAARLFAERGYQVVLQSCRGTWDAGGALTPFFQEREDGIDTVDWIEAQRWFAGRLATYGPSYLGNVQWAIAADLGDRLSAMAVAISLSDFRDEIRQGGGFTLEGTLGWTYMMANQHRFRGVLGTLRHLAGQGRIPPTLFDHLPLAELDRMATGKSLSYWRSWLDHDPRDAFWKPLDHRARFPTVTAPVTMVAGWSDIFLPFQLRDFSALRAAGRDARITIGPWTHIGAMATKWPVADALDWFDHHLKGRPLASRRRVKYLLEGEGEWHEADAWPTHSAAPAAFHLASGGRLVREPTPDSGVDSFTYDPADPTPSVGGASLSSRDGHGSLRRLVARADVLSYTSEPLPAALDLIGPVSVKVGVGSDRPDHDLFFCVFETGADGVPMHVTDGYVRLHAEDGAEAGRAVLVTCWPMARRVARGSRLGLLIAGGAHPRYARNTGTAEPLGSTTALHKVRIDIRRDVTTLFLPAPNAG
jgi:putative CocE/NonD family hydrolase